jgi:hypothetical protein
MRSKLLEELLIVLETALIVLAQVSGDCRINGNSWLFGGDADVIGVLSSLICESFP